MKGHSIILEREGKNVGEKEEIIKPRPQWSQKNLLLGGFEEDSNTNILKK